MMPKPKKMGKLKSGAYCSEADCDIHDIYEILSRHIESGPVNEEEEKLPFNLEDYD